MKNFTFVIISFFSLSFTRAQSPEFDWVKQMGDTTGNIFILSSTTDASGNLYMTGVLDGTVDVDPGPTSVILTDAGFGDMFVSKIDSGGNFRWAIQIGRESYDQGSSIALDKFGNIFVTGFFSLDSTDFDPGPGFNYLSNSGGARTFVLKLDPAGNFIFAKELGPGENSPNSLTLDASNNILIAGIFGNTVDFNPGIDTANLVSSVNSIYILKLNSLGSYIWAKQIDVNVTSTRCYSIATDASENVYITGLLLGTVDFNPDTGISNLTSSSVFGGEYIVKLDSSGIFNWAKAINGSLSQTGGDRAIRVDDAGNSYTAGWFNDTVDFDPNAGTFNLINTLASGGSTYLMKINSSGNLAWAKQIGDPGDGNFRSFVLDTLNNLYITGTIISTGDFDPGTGIDTLSIIQGSIFVAKYDDAGNLNWAVNFSSDTAGSDQSPKINVDLFGNIITTGFFHGIGDFDPGPGIINLVSNSGEDIFIHKMNQNFVTSVNDHRNMQNNISVYPNPSGGDFYIKTKVAGVYKITDELGQMMRSFYVNAGDKGLVTVTGLSNGIYFVSGINKDKTEVKKIIIQK